MKFERQRDIAAFRNKTFKERMALQREARRRDPAILWLLLLGGAFLDAWLPILSWLAPGLGLLVAMLLYFVLAVPL